MGKHLGIKLYKLTKYVYELSLFIYQSFGQLCSPLNMMNAGYMQFWWESESEGNEVVEQERRRIPGTMRNWLKSE